MELRGRVVPRGSVTNESSQAMSILDAGRDLDAATHVVVSVAQLVGEQLDGVRRALDSVMDDGVVGGSNHALSGRSRHHVEAVLILVSDALINHQSRHGVLVVANVSREESSVHALVDVDEHQLGLSAASSSQTSFDLRDLRLADRNELAGRNSISVDDDPLGLSAVDLFEVLGSLAGD